jgi:methyl-galactoside transport system substrate-binding protein
MKRSIVMKKTRVFLVCLLLVVFTTTAVFAQGGKEQGTLPRIGTTIYKFDDNYMSFVRKAYEAVGAGKAEILLADSMNDQSKQNDQIDTYINKGVKALAVNLVDPAAAGTIIEKARKADLPLIFFNKEPATNEIMSYDKCWYVGITSAEFGILQGDMVADYWFSHPEADRNKDGVLQYVMLKGEPGHRDAELRTTEPIRILKERGIQVEQLELQTGMWDTAKGKDLMETWLAKHGDKIECVIANNDAMALGAVEALKAAGYFVGGKYLPVVGVDGLPEAIDLIKKGQMLGTVLNDPKALGEATFDLALNVAQGKHPLEGTAWTFGDIKDVRVAAEIITLDNLDKAIEAYK